MSDWALEGVCSTASVGKAIKQGQYICIPPKQRRRFLVEWNGI